MHKLILLIAIAGMALSGCGEGCGGAMDDVRAKYGPPQDVTQTTASGGQATLWMYYTRGVGFSFTETKNGFTKSCEQTTSTFTPIRKEAILKFMGYSTGTY